MVVGIDASNIMAGGGLIHLKEILSHNQFSGRKIEKVVIWASAKTLKTLPNKYNIIKVSNFFTNNNILLRLFWQVFILQFEIKKNNCDVLFLPGATFVLTKVPKISMCQNLLPFMWKEIFRFGISFYTIKLIILRLFQTLSFLNSDGIIFLSDYSRKYIFKKINLKSKKSIIIQHGVNDKFYQKVKKQLSIDYYSKTNPYKFLYVSDIWPYKNHLILIQCVANLRNQGYPVSLDLIGGGLVSGIKKLKNKIKKLDPKSEFIFYGGEKKINEIIKFYHKTDGFVFNSSCETFGQILTEAMLSGLPIICSEETSMPEILGDSYFYCNPFNSISITKAFQDLMLSTSKRRQVSNLSQNNAKKLTWLKCSKETFSFISIINCLVKNNFKA